MEKSGAGGPAGIGGSSGPRRAQDAGCTIECRVEDARGGVQGAECTLYVWWLILHLKV
jgi:hypothetical protein